MKLEPLLAAAVEQNFAMFAIRPKQQPFALQIAQRHGCQLLEPMALRHDDDNPLPVQRAVSKALVGASHISGDHGIETIAEQQVIET